MAKARSTFVVLLLFMWTAAPALRCAIPSESLTPDEQACCKEMGGHCGDMENHSCCKKVESGLQPGIAATPTSAPHFIAIATLPVETLSLTAHHSLFNGGVTVSASPPPPTVQRIVLRI
jgi:hypothetical protein